MGENKVLRKIFSVKRDEIIGYWRKLLNVINTRAILFQGPIRREIRATVRIR